MAKQNKQNMTVWTDKNIIDFLDRLAKKTRRSRNQVVGMILKGVADQKKQNLNKLLHDLACEELICPK